MAPRNGRPKLAEIRFAEKQLASPTESEVRAMDINSDAMKRSVLTVMAKRCFSPPRPRSTSSHGQVDPNTKAHYYDIYQSTLSSDSVWSEPQYLNVGRNHATVLPDVGEKLIVQDDDGWTHETKTTKKGARMDKAEPMVLDKAIPNKSKVVFFPSRDRLIASIKSRGEGGFDLFESAMSEDVGGQVEVLGTRVNTWGDEITPFVAADGKPFSPPMDSKAEVLTSTGPPETQREGGQNQSTLVHRSTVWTTTWRLPLVRKGNGLPTVGQRWGSRAVRKSS